MDIRLFLPPRPGVPPSTVIVTGIPDEAERGPVESLARKVLEARVVAPYLGRVGWAEVESAAQRHGMADDRAGGTAAVARPSRKAAAGAPARSAKSGKRIAGKKSAGSAKKKGASTARRTPKKKRTS